MLRFTVFTLAIGVVAVQANRPFTRVHSAITSGFTEPTEMVISDQKALTSAWYTLAAGIAGVNAPAVDLTRKVVVLLALGERHTGGYTIHTDSVVTAGDNAFVHYTVTTPGSDCMTSQMQTSPVEVISFDRIKGDVQFKQRKAVGKC